MAHCCCCSVVDSAFGGTGGTDAKRANSSRYESLGAGHQAQRLATTMESGPHYSASFSFVIG